MSSTPLVCFFAKCILDLIELILFYCVFLDWLSLVNQKLELTYLTFWFFFHLGFTAFDWFELGCVQR